MGVKLKIDSDMTELFQAFSQKNMREYLTAIGDLELSQTRQRFVKQVDPDGNAWKVTVRKIINPSAKILRKSGGLFNSIQRKVHGNSVFIGTNLSYAEVHQNGAVIKAKNKKFLKFSIEGGTFFKKQVTIPQRRFVGINNQTQKNIEQAFNATMRKILK